jgi:hypothetical protein
MARGRTTSLTIRLTPAERLTLPTWQRATTISAGVARRARLLLLLADGLTITDAATTVGLGAMPTSGYGGLCRKVWWGWTRKQALATAASRCCLR